MDLDHVSFEPEFTFYQGLRIRYVASPRPSAESVLLLSPWPESIYAFVRMWQQLSEQFSLVAVDLPGFGQSRTLSRRRYHHNPSSGAESSITSSASTPMGSVVARPSMAMGACGSRS